MVAHSRHNICTSKHAWTLDIWPDLKSRRPHQFPGVTEANTRTLTKWALCEADIEANTIYSKIEKSQRFCGHCKLRGVEVVENANHALTTCFRAGLAQGTIVSWYNVEFKKTFFNTKEFLIDAQGQTTKTLADVYNRCAAYLDEYSRRRRVELLSR